MKTESMLFGGVALFFGSSAALYGMWSGDETGTVALVVACGMAALVSFFCLIQYRRRGTRAQDRTGAEVADGAGPVAFFPDESMWPVVTALGAAVTATGVVYGLWLFLIGLGVLVRGVFGMVFQYPQR
ncbi:cytochrome c oxidase subunit 4 [Streptomyces sp. FXJ1.172]|uniref:aa3-type cytochrome oxidase subunit IV n=1 Tax=Streptomyces sp. FXJ1.172 TaxID=710705 RepID=UPI0007CF26CD|nr:cytochrome c oxidase subunit 4 [Streptomyces sp. FXJ1.172]WEO93791.1 cytochrome c oxidase subunit 4 [Streptomyces sp. FXJ1.172]